LTSVVEVDLTTVVRECAAAHAADGPDVALTVFAVVAEAAVQALPAHPRLNASLDLAQGTVTYPAAVHIGIALETDAGQVVAVVRDAGDLSVAGLTRRVTEIANGERGTVHTDEDSDATFTVADTGQHGVLFDTPIIHQPQSAVLGLGAIVRRPVVVVSAGGEERIAIRAMAYLALTYDHRLIDGADAARYLAAVKHRLEHAAPDHTTTRTQH
jgi:2-oxoglutarate dehydrogenase E2 component (dihydrolipoamide succinyltransferase)